MIDEDSIRLHALCQLKTKKTCAIESPFEIGGSHQMWLSSHNLNSLRTLISFSSVCHGNLEMLVPVEWVVTKTIPMWHQASSHHLVYFYLCGECCPVTSYNSFSQIYLNLSGELCRGKDTECKIKHFFGVFSTPYTCFYRMILYGWLATLFLKLIFLWRIWMILEMDLSLEIIF